MKENKKRILVDFDNTLVESTNIVLDLFQEDTGKEFKYYNINAINWDFSPWIKAEELPKILEYFDCESFYERAKLMPNAYEVLKELSERYDIIACSKCATDKGSTLKTKWIKENLPFVKDIIILRQENFDKSHVEGDFIIDDRCDCLVGDRIFKIKFGEYKYNRLFNIEDEIFDKLMDEQSKGSLLLSASYWLQILTLFKYYELGEFDHLLKGMIKN